jgi:GNAT superfamily N-acetyltransferase
MISGMDPRIRRATQADADALADLYLRARKAAAPTIPMTVHSDDAVRHWITCHVMPQAEVWVSVTDGGAIVGLLVLNADCVEQLYVDPGLLGRAIGTTLLDVAKRERPGGLRLWTFEANLRARHFYERHGFVARDQTAGNNEEGAPDVLYVWEGG